jgi:phage terminase small subunit
MRASKPGRSRNGRNKRAEREETFAREYLIDLNGSRAAVAAGYSPKGADVRAAELLGNRRVKDLIEKLAKDKLEKLEISAEWVLGELRKLAGYDAGAIFNDDGSLKPIKEWDASARAALVALDHDHLFEYFGKGQRKHIGNTVKVKLADKLRALELLGKYLKLFTDKVEVTASEDLAALIAEGRKRAARR